MKKPLKITMVIVGVLVLLLVGLTLFVKSYLSSDRLKPIILPKAEAATGRKVQIDEINVSLFKGIVTKGLSVKEKDGQKDFLKIGRFVLSYRLLPLLKKQLVISKIEIVSPSISIKKDREGKYNFSDIMEKRSQELFGLQFAGEGSFTAEGALNGNLQCVMDGSSTIQKTLKGTAVAKLGKGAINQSQIFDAIALLTGVPSLKNPGFDEGLFNFDVREEKVFLDGWIRSPLCKVSPKGMVDFKKRLDIPTELKLSPNLTGSLKGRLAAIKFLDDEQGWKVIPLRIKGTTDKPSVNLDEEALSKQLGRGLTKEIEKRLFERTPKESEKPSKKTKSKDILKELLGE